MAGITLAVAESTLNSYLTAEVAILAGQSIARNGKQLTMADLSAVQSGVSLWSKRVASLSGEVVTARGANTVEVIPR